MLKRNPPYKTKDHEKPILSQIPTHVPVYTLPNESGYFPCAGDKLLVTCPNCRFYQLQNMHNQDSESTQIPTLLSQGQLTLHDPAPGTPHEVVLIGECDGVIFYVTEDDVTLLLSQTELTLICFPSLDCLYLSLPDAMEEHVLLHLQGLFAARTNLYEAGAMIHKKQIELICRDEGVSDHAYRSTVCNNHEGTLKSIQTDDNVQRFIYQSSMWIAEQIVLLSEAGAKRVEDHGYRLRSFMQPSVDCMKCDPKLLAKDVCKMHHCNKRMNINPVAVQRASHIRNFTRHLYNLAEQGSDSISSFVGGIIGSSITEKSDDGENMRYARQLLRTTVLAFSEICDGVDKSFDILTGTTKREASACVAVQYGDDAAQLCRHTLGSTIDFCKTYLTVRRVLNVKRVAQATFEASSREEPLVYSL